MGEEEAVVERRQRGRGRQDGEGRRRLKVAEGNKEERLAAAAAGGGRRRSSMEGEEEAELSLSALLSRPWLSGWIEKGNLRKHPCNSGVSNIGP